MSYLLPTAAKLHSLRGVAVEATLAATTALVWRPATTGEVQVSGGVLILAPDGADRTVTLPPIDSTLIGAELVIEHGDGANALTIRNPGDTATRATLATGEAVLLRAIKDSSGARWLNLGVAKAT